MSDSRDHIISVACRLFLRKSYKEVTMKELVQSTGLSKGAFYHYFESKEQLFGEVLNYFFTSVLRHAYENYSRESFYKFYHDYANEVKRFTEKYVPMLKENETDGEFSINYFTLAFDALKLFPEFRSLMIDGQHRELKIWTDVIRDARINGEIKTTMTDEELAQIFIFTGDGIAMHMVLEGANAEEMVSPFLTLWDSLYKQIKV